MSLSSIFATVEYSLTAKFDEGDPANEWILLFLTQENVWQRSRNFTVSATNSRRKWSVKTWVDPTVKGSTEYVPSYQQPQLFHWRGCWIEIQRSSDTGQGSFMPPGIYMPTATIYFTYAVVLFIVSFLVEDARARYVEINRPNVVIHLIDTPHLGPSMAWNNVKNKKASSTRSCGTRRWYLLYGPPGTGKTSTIYALAGALNVDIYSLSGFVDDSFLMQGRPEGMMKPVGSEEGKLFFATTNYIDRLDRALLRLGRIDRKVVYGLATARAPCSCASSRPSASPTSTYAASFATCFLVSCETN
ncbi:P-loop containing nucleoside triphosphate hydrolase protein [Mycena sp. CBHHK59/15]|nr:P-loop containing nucleoside triphosphate hydrolase protein [Mycena sp. CBHHK59/15]